jgi:hypothetical protein
MAISITSLNAEDENSCREYYEKYDEIVYDYRLRIEDKTDKYGCETIKMYANMISLQDMELFMDVLDENSDLISATQKIILEKKVYKLLSEFPMLKHAVFNERTTSVHLNNLYALIKKRMNYAISKKIHLQPDFFNYFIIASNISSNSKETLSNYDQLRKTLQFDKLNLFYAFYIAIEKKMTFTELLKNIQTLQKSLNNTQNEDLLHYPQYYDVSLCQDHLIQHSYFTHYATSSNSCFLNSKVFMKVS